MRPSTQTAGTTSTHGAGVCSTAMRARRQLLAAAAARARGRGGSGQQLRAVQGLLSSTGEPFAPSSRAVSGGTEGSDDERGKESASSNTPDCLSIGLTSLARVSQRTRRRGRDKKKRNSHASFSPLEATHSALSASAAAMPDIPPSLLPPREVDDLAPIVRVLGQVELKPVREVAVRAPIPHSQLFPPRRRESGRL